MIAISYRRDDSLAIAGRLYDRLQAKFGKPNIFMDFDSIRAGLDFRNQIRETIEHSDVVIALIGPHWIGPVADASRRIDDPNDFVRLEIAHALKRDIPIIPVLINHTSMPDPETLPEDLRGLVYRHGLPLDSGLDFHLHADRVIASVCDLADASSLGRPQSEKSKAVPAVPGRPRWRAASVLLTVLLLAGIGIGAWFLYADKTKRKIAFFSRARVSSETSSPDPAEASAQKSWVEISSRPSGARVLNNGIEIGTTPLRRDDLATGRAKFILMNDGYLPCEVDGVIDPKRGFKGEVALVRPAPLYVGTVRVRDRKQSRSSRPITIELASDLASGTMTQGTKRGDFVVRFSGVWEGAELHAVTGDVVAQPARIQWTPESFLLRFSEDGAQADYECVAEGITYFANLSAQSEFVAHLAAVYAGTVSSSNTPIKIVIGADRKSGTLTETSKSGETAVRFTGVWTEDTFHGVTGDVVSKPGKVQWKPESFTLRVMDDGQRLEYTCNDDGRILTGELSPAP